MSYDVGIGSVSHNYTSNVSRLFYDHIPDFGKGGGLHELNGLTGKQAADIIADAFDRIDGTRSKFWSEGSVGEVEFSAKYDAPNGWGSAIGALVFLAKIQGACIKNPRCKVFVCS
mgnify:FL=1